MNKILNHIPIFILLLALFFSTVLPRLAWAPASSFTCTAGNLNSGGAINTQATGSGAHNVVIDTAGAMSYNAALNGPATGTAIVCAVSNIGKNDVIGVYCDASGTITNAGGCCGTTDRNITAYSVKAVGGTTLGPAACAGIGTKVGTFKATNTGAGDGTVTLGATMDATHVKIGGTYTLAASAPGKVNVKVIDETTPQTFNATADLSAVFTSLVGFSSTGTMDFKKVGFSGVPGAGDHVDLGTDGTVASAGNFQGNAGTVAGQVTINNVQNGVTVQVQCDTTIHLTNAANTHSINVTGLKAAAEGSTGTYAGAGSACNGSGGAVATTMVYTAGTADQFFFGGKLDGGTASGLAGEVYSSTNPGGTSATVIVLNQ